MSIFDMFRQAPTQQPAPQQQAPQPVNPGNLTAPTAEATQTSPTTAANGVVPNSGQPASQPASPEATNSPLADFATLWDNIPNQASPEAGPTELNQEDVMKAVTKADFTKALSPDKLAAITAGGEEAAKAFAESLNIVAQQVLAHATMVNNKLTNSEIARAMSAYEAKIPSVLRDQITSNHLRETNPLFSNPAIKPVIEATRSQLLTKFPNATPAEIHKLTEQYIVAMGKAFAPAPAVTRAPDDVNWETFLSPQ